VAITGGTDALSSVLYSVTEEEEEDNRAYVVQRSKEKRVLRRVTPTHG